MKAKTKLKDKDIRYGTVEMTDDELKESQNPKMRTTMFLEVDLIRLYKREAAKRGLKYQQLMREKLRSALRAESDVENRLRRLEARVLKKAI